jgi:hypothetical protein
MHERHFKYSFRLLQAAFVAPYVARFRIAGDLLEYNHGG